MNQIKIGILGGMSTVATAEYYNLINKYVRSYLGGFNTAEMIISSVNFGTIEKFVRNEDWINAGLFLSRKAVELQNAGVNCIFLATNTMHIIREEIKASIDIPLIDIFETTSKEIKKQGIKEVGILGTYPVMTDSFFKNTFSEYGIELLSPSESDKLGIDQIIFNELTKNQFIPQSKLFFLEIMRKLQQNGAKGIVLGCTEIKLLINQSDIEDLPLFDTTTLHCIAAAKICTRQIEL